MVPARAGHERIGRDRRVRKLPTEPFAALIADPGRYGRRGAERSPGYTVARPRGNRRRTGL
jgi:hypothetical protein